MSEVDPPYRVVEPPASGVSASFWLGLFSIAGVGCCLTIALAPYAGAVGVLLGLRDVWITRRHHIGRNRALLGLGCSVATCLFWIWLLNGTDWSESGIN
ncbi:hypothetical protein [Streptomyces albidochromogenes]|uniref:hypothetical protein n=1 Tax=Streptomyces albidochromogenes TaxID=329524 RepID=UPI00110F94D6|nr:hypothetical protein [Streptomyces albidochromogenes]